VDAPATTQKPPRQGLFGSYWFRGAMLLAFVEGILVAFDIIPRWVAVTIAAAVIVAYFVRGRRIKDASVRQGVWALALSQAVVLLVPLIAWIVGAAAVVIAAVAAAIVIFALIVDR